MDPFLESFPGFAVYYLPSRSLFSAADVSQFLISSYFSLFLNVAEDHPDEQLWPADRPHTGNKKGFCWGLLAKYGFACKRDEDDASVLDYESVRRRRYSSLMMFGRLCSHVSLTTHEVKPITQRRRATLFSL